MYSSKYVSKYFNVLSFISLLIFCSINAYPFACHCCVFLIKVITQSCFQPELKVAPKIIVFFTYEFCYTTSGKAILSCVSKRWESFLHWRYLGWSWGRQEPPMAGEDGRSRGNAGWWGRGSKSARGSVISRGTGRGLLYSLLGWRNGILVCCPPSWTVEM